MDAPQIQTSSLSQFLPDDRSTQSNQQTEVAQAIQHWQHYSQRVQEPNSVRKDEQVARLALADGRKQGLSVQDNHKLTGAILWQSPYVQWLFEEQGQAKTQDYITLTIRAAQQSERSVQQQRDIQRQRQRSPDRQKQR